MRANDLQYNSFVPDRGVVHVVILIDAQHGWEDKT